MAKITLYLRKDLNMPLGKEIAQLTHAMGALVLGCFDFEKRQWKTEQATAFFTDSHAPENLEDMMEIQECQSADAFENILPNEGVVIVDQGHTVFKGVPTPTVGLRVEEDIRKVWGFSQNPHEPKSTDVRMNLIVNKAFVRKNKATIVQQAVLAYTCQIINALDAYARNAINETAQDDLISWCTGAFAKITLVGDEEKLNACYKTILESEKGPQFSAFYQDDVLNMLTIAPAKKDWFQGKTSDFKML